MLINFGIVIQPGYTKDFQGLTPVLFARYFFTYIVVLFCGGLLGEEPGWWGFTFPRLQKKYGSLSGTLLLRLLWTVWHLPNFLT